MRTNGSVATGSRRVQGWVGGGTSLTPPVKSCPEIAVVVPTYNRADRLEAVLDALEAQTLDKAKFEVIVVDDGSTDGSWQQLQSMAGRYSVQVRPLRNARNSGGPAAPRNLGWRATGAGIIAFLDDDCTPKPGWLEAGLTDMTRNPRIGVMQGCTLPPAGVAFQRMRPGTVWRAILKPTPQFEATNIFYRREALEAVGGFDESMSTWGEDSDLGWKVVESSWERGFCPRAVAIHDVEQRGWRHNVRFAWLDGNLVRVAARHPGYRKELFWRPWAVHRSSVELLLALAGLIAARWRRVALVAVLPYLLSVRARASSHGQAPTPGLLMETVVVDVTRCAAHLSASATNRVLVL